jgi:hypothetical protein
MQVISKERDLMTVNGINIKHALGDAKWLKKDIIIVSFLCHAINKKFLNFLLNYDTFASMWHKLLLKMFTIHKINFTIAK